MQLTGMQFTSTTALLGNDLSTLPDYPAEIRAPAGTLFGVSGFQIHFGSTEINTPGDACDVVQEVFLKVFRSIGSFRAQSSLKTWVYRIAMNEAHNHRRWFGRRRGREVGLDDDQGEGKTFEQILPDPARSPFEVTRDNETMHLVEEALAGLRPAFREAVLLRDIEGLSYEEFAEILEISLGTVKSRILRGREALRERLTGRLEPGHAASNNTAEWAGQAAR